MPSDLGQSDAAYDVTEEPTCKEIRLSIKKVFKKSLVGNIILIVLAVILISFYPTFITTNSQSIFPGLAIDDVGLVALTLLIIFIIFVANLVYQYLYYKEYYYDMKADTLIIRKGVLIRKEISIPFEKIQDVYVDRDALDWVFGLYDVHLSSATIPSGVVAHMDGVNQANATKLREMVFRRIKKSAKSYRRVSPTQNA